MSSYNLVPGEKPEVKSPLKSKTIWINVLTLVAGVIGYIAGQDLIANNTALIAGLVALQGLVNTGLRFLTWQKLGLKS